MNVSHFSPAAKRRWTFVLIAAFVGAIALASRGQQSDSYTVAPFDERSVCCASFGRDYVAAIPKSVGQRIYADQTRGRKQFEAAYAGTLHRWFHEDLRGLNESQLRETLRRLIETTLQENREALMWQFPELPGERMTAAHVMQLVHGHYEFATQSTPCTCADELLSLSHGDCSELADACGLLLSLFDDSAQVGMLAVDYETDLGLFCASHAVVAAEGIILDPTVNMIITKSFGEIRALPAETRFEDLADAGQLHLGYNRFLEPRRRRVQIEEQNTDAGVLAFYYPWYLRGLSAPESSIAYREIVTHRRFARAPETDSNRKLLR